MPKLPCWLGSLVLMAAWMAVTYHPAAAHGGGAPRLVNVPIDAFVMSVWTNPDPLRVGVVHVTVSLAETAALEGANQPGAAALGQTIALTIMPAAGGAPITTAVTHEQAANKLFYEADITIPGAGSWVFALVVNGSAEQHFTAEVMPARPPVAWLGLAALAGVALVAVWLWRRSRGVNP